MAESNILGNTIHTVYLMIYLKVKLMHPGIDNYGMSALNHVQHNYRSYQHGHIMDLLTDLPGIYISIYHISLKNIYG